jgi:NAD(P)-dependent dehydrogenase (short-subunit alcohol dehydrogenase family)
MKAPLPESSLRAYGQAVAIVTGAGSGIGKALAEALAALGAHAVVTDIEDGDASAVADAITARGHAASAATLDVRDPVAVKRLVDDTVKRHGRLDFLFNNAGIGIGGELRHHSLEHWERVVSVNLMGVVHGVQAAYPVMERQGFGHIVNTASMAGLVAISGVGAYAAAKHAVVGLTKVLRIEAAAAGVRASVICPGVVDTPILAGGKHGAILLPRRASRKENGETARWLRSQIRRTRPMNPATFAAKALRQVARNRAIIIVPAWWRVFWWLDRGSPTLAMGLARRACEKHRRDLADFLDGRHEDPAKPGPPG